MAIFKCKMCGGDLNIEEETNVIECEYCGTTQTIPSMDNEKKINLFNRANRLRLSSEFDKAASIYESIIAEFPEEAEAYWGLCLCNYGIEYVDDPATAKKVPTCHRASFEKLANDENFELAMEYADVVAQKVYRDEAREIDRIMGNILSISKDEISYDVFICYKETDDKGERTIDSILAQDIYDALTSKGLKVFFARITLEDKLGQMYEPYIFAALNSAKVMLSVGTKYEHFHAVWVKNEWSRFLKLMAKDKSKVLIPCYKDMDAYDLPDEFKVLQAQNMGKIGFMQDLIRGVEKITGPAQTVIAEKPVQVNSEAENIVNLGFIDLKVGKKESAHSRFLSALEKDENCITAYIGLCIDDFSDKNEVEIYVQKIFKKSPHISDTEKKLISNDKEILNKYIELFVKYHSKERLEYLFKYHNEVFVDYEIVSESGKEKYSLLLYAIFVQKNIDYVRDLLEIGLDPNKRCYYHTENKKLYIDPLSSAIVFAKENDMKKLLVDYGADANNSERKLGDGSTLSALVDAVLSENIELVKILLGAGADPNKMKITYTNETASALYAAMIRQSNIELARKLLDAGGTASVLFDAIIRQDNIELARMLLDAGADPNSVEKVGASSSGVTVLGYAISIRKNPEFVKLLLEYGADPNKECYNSNGDTKLPLGAAVTVSTEMVRLLLKAGAKVDGKSVMDSEENTALYLALLDGADDIHETVKLLLEAGADATETGTKERADGKYSMLSLALEWGVESYDLVKLLLQHGASFDDYYSTVSPLINAAYINEKELVEMLLEKGFDPNMSEIHECALSGAIDNENYEIAELLLKNGANPNVVIEACNKEVDSMLSLAIKKQNEKLVELFLKYNADWDEQITCKGITKSVRKYPFNKKFDFSASFIKFLKSKGWRGSIF